MKRSVNEYDENRGGGYAIPRNSSKNRDQQVMENLGLAFGVPAAGAGLVAIGNADSEMNKLGNARREREQREAEAEMKRESRGVKKPANFDAMQESIQDAKDAAARKKISGMGYAKGGKVGSASKRADGIATKGKTKGTMITMYGGGKC
jgi:hypothetical protein